MDFRRQVGLFQCRLKHITVLIVILSLTAVAFSWFELFGNNQANAILSRVIDSPTLSNSRKFVIGKKVAAIIENRPLDNLLTHVVHFSSVLGSDWSIVLFTSLSLSSLNTSAPFKEGLSDGRFQIKSLPRNVHVDNNKTVSSFLTKPWFWDQLAPADHVLLFQSNSILCANSPKHVNDFLEYDMIGAPIVDGMGQGYSGGFSLRNRKKMLQIVRKHNWEEAWETAQRRKSEEAERQRLLDEQTQREHIAKEQQEQPYRDHGKQSSKRQKEMIPPSHTYVFPENPTPPLEDYEDQWFFKHLVELPKKWNGDRGANLPGAEIAKTFAVNMLYFDKPVGYVGLQTMINDREYELGKYCPEYHLCTWQQLESSE